MGRLSTCVLLLTLIALCSGCGTLQNLSGEKTFYGGVAVDMELAEDPPLPQDGQGWYWTFDMPFSFVADTVLLPIYGMIQLFQYLEPHIQTAPPEEPTTPDGAKPGDKKPADEKPADAKPPAKKPDKPK